MFFKEILLDVRLATQPFLKVSLTPLQGDAIVMDVYRMNINKRSKTQFDENGNPLLYDLDRYWAVVNTDLGFVGIQDFVFGKIFRKRNEFFQKNTAAVTK